MTEVHHRSLERLYAGAKCNAYFAPRIRVGEGTCEIVIPVRDDFFHGGGAVHGSVLFKALDDAAFFAANSVVNDFLVLTSSFHVHFLRPIREGDITAAGRVVHRTPRLLVAESVARDSDGREVARGSGSFVVSRIPLAPGAAASGEGSTLPGSSAVEREP